MLSQLVTVLLYLLSFVLVSTANDFAGANSYFLFAVSVSINFPAIVRGANRIFNHVLTQDSDRLEVLDAMQSANMKRIKIS